MWYQSRHPGRFAGAGEPLTAREAQVAQVARDGLSNPEIGAGCSSARARSSTT
jgi:DNA-binding NarL/FixJ family response regulator